MLQVWQVWTLNRRVPGSGGEQVQDERVQGTPVREDKHSSKGKHFSKSKRKDRDKRRPARVVTRRTRQEPWWPVQATSTEAQATRSQAQAVKMKTPGCARARRVQAGTLVD
jgi:hypothetical protein